MRHNNIDGVIFDLDDTLFDCTGQLSGAARQRAADVICSQKPDLDIQTLIQCQETLSETLGSSGALKEIGRQYGLSDTLLNQARSAYNLNIVENITPFPETVATLDRLAQRGYKLALVTSGHPDRQRLKVEQLQLTAYFHEKNGTLVLHDDQKSTDKGPFIQQAADQLNLPCEVILAVGDKLDAEISAANALGMMTVRIRHGRQKNRLPKAPEEYPDMDINTLDQLLSILP